MTKLIRVKNVSKIYDKLTAVKDLSFDVSSGEIFGILGPNGAGKTTTVAMMITLLRPSAGKISIKSKDVITQGKDIRKFIGVVFQESLLDDDLTIEENLDIQGLLYFSDSKLRAQRISAVIKLTDLVNHRKKKSSELSGGLRKRLEIARGLMNNPEIIFLDEPTLGLDPLAKNNIWEYIKILNKKEHKTIILTTNDMIEAERLCNKIMIINNGKRIWSGTTLQLKGKGKTLEKAFINIVRKK